MELPGLQGDVHNWWWQPQPVALFAAERISDEERKPSAGANASNRSPAGRRSETRRQPDREDIRRPQAFQIRARSRSPHHSSG